MSAFVASGGSAEPFTLVNDGWWPDIDGDALRDAQRIKADVTNQRLEFAVVAAMISVNRELAAWKATQLAAGYATLADVPAEQIGGRSHRVALYERAIYSATSAECAERYRSYDATRSGGDSAEEEERSIDDYRRDQRLAIRDLLGVARTTVELL